MPRKTPRRRRPTGWQWTQTVPTIPGRYWYVDREEDNETDASLVALRPDGEWVWVQRSGEPLGGCNGTTFLLRIGTRLRFLGPFPASPPLT